MEIQVRGSLNKESEVMGGLSFELYERYACRTDRVAMFLGKQFLSRILDAYYCEPHDILAEYDHVIYSDSDGKKVIVLRYDTDTYKVTVRKRDIPDIINYLRDNYNFFYDPNRKELEKAVKEAEIEQHCGKNREDFWRERALKAEEELKRKSNKIAGIEEGLQWKDKIIERQKQSIKELGERLKENTVDKQLEMRAANKLANLRLSILQVYREIFDCSNGDPEGTDEETMQDILTEYKRVLKMKDDAETDNTKWRPYIADILGMDKGSDWSDICIRARLIKHDKDNFSNCLTLLRQHIKEAYAEVFPDDTDRTWFGNYRQAVTDIVEALKQLKRQNDRGTKYVRRMRELEQKLEDIKNICDGDSDILNIIGE